MDDVWGAKKHHFLGFKQHLNWKMLVEKQYTPCDLGWYYNDP